jgi:hypothetical protein
MNDDRNRDADNTGPEEPELTQRNSRTVLSEDDLAEAEAESDELKVEGSSTRTKLGVIPSSYGASGGIGENAEE